MIFQAWELVVILAPQICVPHLQPLLVTTRQPTFIHQAPQSNKNIYRGTLFARLRSPVHAQCLDGLGHTNAWLRRLVYSVLLL